MRLVFLVLVGGEHRIVIWLRTAVGSAKSSSVSIILTMALIYLASGVPTPSEPHSSVLLPQKGASPSPEPLLLFE